MKIEIDKKWSLDSDAYNWILLEKVDGVNPKTKEPTVTTKRRYYPTLEKLLAGWADMRLKDCESFAEIKYFIIKTAIELQKLRKEVMNASTD